MSNGNDDRARPRDASDRAAGYSETPPAEPPSGPSEENELRDVGPEEAGLGSGLDEAELGRRDPLDHKPWNGDADEPLQGAPSADEDFPAERRGPGEIQEGKP